MQRMSCYIDSMTKCFDEYSVFTFNLGPFFPNSIFGLQHHSCARYLRLVTGNWIDNSILRWNIIDILLLLSWHGARMERASMRERESHTHTHTTWLPFEHIFITEAAESEIKNEPWADPVQIIIILSVYFFAFVYVKHLCEPCIVWESTLLLIWECIVIQSERSRLNKWHWAFAESLLFVAWRKKNTLMLPFHIPFSAEVLLHFFLPSHFVCSLSFFLPSTDGFIPCNFHVFFLILFSLLFCSTTLVCLRCYSVRVCTICIILCTKRKTVFASSFFLSSQFRIPLFDHILVHIRTLHTILQSTTFFFWLCFFFGVLLLFAW